MGQGAARARSLPLLSAHGADAARGRRKEMTRATFDSKRTAANERERKRWIEDLTATEVVRTSQPTRAAGLGDQGLRSSGHCSCANGTSDESRPMKIARQRGDQGGVEGVRDADRPIRNRRSTARAPAHPRSVQLVDSTESSGSSLTRARLGSEP